MTPHRRSTISPTREAEPDRRPGRTGLSPCSDVPLPVGLELSMRLPGRLDAIDEADESRPLLESAPPMPSSRIDRRSGAASASASISPRISAVVRGCFGDNVIGCRFGGFGQPPFDLEVHIDRDSAAPS